ncbi:MAG: hypothetical protein IJJ45_04145 [Clostridia bacterium]|nr:hypothetical protein [Clostridia bacterium]
MTGSVSGKTDYLIANDQNGSLAKLQKVRQLGVKIIIDETEFLELAGLDWRYETTCCSIWEESTSSKGAMTYGP